MLIANWADLEPADRELINEVRTSLLHHFHRGPGRPSVEIVRMALRRFVKDYPVEGGVLGQKVEKGT